jgi:hypothetical protein
LLEAKDFESITGKGSGTVNGKKLGNAKLMEQNNSKTRMI